MNAVSRKILRFLVWMLGLLMFPLVTLVSWKRSRKVPPINDPILMHSATTLARMIRLQEISSEAVVQAFIRRCQEVNPFINAIVEPRYELAISEAKNADRLVAAQAHSVQELEDMFPLLGVPVTVKESIAVAGMSNEAGRFRSKRRPAEKDAECITQVRAAGAIPILVSNTPELCMNWETYNSVTGTTNNPHDTRRTPGGSSGGEAALLSCGASVIGVGSDIAGSLRLPAMFTGVFGHKPTPGAVSTKGHAPESDDKDWTKFFTLGPMARHAEDLPLLLKVLKDPSGPKLQLDKKVSIKQMRFFYMEGDYSGISSKVGPDVKEAMQKVVNHFAERHGIKVIEVKMKNIKNVFMSSVMCVLKLDNVETIFSKPDRPGEWRSVWPEILRKIFGCSKSNATTIAYGPLKISSRMLGNGAFEKASKINDSLRNEFTSLLKEDAVCFYPTFPTTANLHYEVYKNVLNYTYALMFNALGLPVTNCPVGLSKKGMPVGLQVVASPGCDHLSFAVAKELEEAFGGWTPPHQSR